jgi:hypothetical protein
MPELTITSLCPLQSRLPHIYHGQRYARVDLNPQSRLYPPVRDFVDLASGLFLILPGATYLVLCSIDGMWQEPVLIAQEENPFSSQ